eukprot:352629-Chlamydomonas_euryale.AAC.2
MYGIQGTCLRRVPPPSGSGVQGVACPIGPDRSVRVRICTYALQSFFVDHVWQEALSQLPAGEQFGVQIITKSGGALLTESISRIVALMSALGMVDAVASKYGLFIRAAKTKIMVLEDPDYDFAYI